MRRAICLELGQSISRGVLHRAVSDPVGENGETNLRLGAQTLRIVLHHALQSSRRLERRLCGILVLWIDKLFNRAASLLQLLGVLGQTDDELVNVPRERRETGRIVDVTLRVSRRPQKRVELVVLDVDGHLASILVSQERNGADSLLGLSRDAERVELQTHRLGNAECAGNDAENERVGVLEEDDPLFALRHPLGE